MSFLLVLSTASSRREAQKIAQHLLDERLAACVNIVGQVESFYWWKGKKIKGREALMLIKTRAAAFGKLEKAIRKIHSYSVPEIIAFPIRKGSAAYLKWVREEVWL